MFQFLHMLLSETHKFVLFVNIGNRSACQSNDGKIMVSVMCVGPVVQQIVLLAFLFMTYLFEKLRCVKLPLGRVLSPLIVPCVPDQLFWGLRRCFVCHYWQILSHFIILFLGHWYYIYQVLSQNLFSVLVNYLYINVSLIWDCTVLCIRWCW